MKRSQSTVTKYAEYLPAVIAFILLVALWQGVCVFGIVPPYMLPSPVKVIQAFVSDAPLLASHSVVTLSEAFLGLIIGKDTLESTTLAQFFLQIKFLTSGLL